MKKSAILEEAHIHDESGQKYEVHKKSLPKLSYSAAMQSYFIASGAIHQVETCKAQFIEELVNAAIQTTKKPETCVTSLTGLDLRENLDRWWALLELTRQHATIPLYATREEAEKAQKQRQSASKVV